MSRGRGRGARNKRKISGDGNFDQFLKTPRHGRSPENGGNVSKSVSDALRTVRSVLYEGETDSDMEQMFSTPPASPSKLGKTKHSGEGSNDLASKTVSVKQTSGPSISVHDDESVLSYLKKKK